MLSLKATQIRIRLQLWMDAHQGLMQQHIDSCLHIIAHRVKLGSATQGSKHKQSSAIRVLPVKEGMQGVVHVADVVLNAATQAN